MPSIFSVASQCQYGTTTLHIPYGLRPALSFRGIEDLTIETEAEICLRRQNNHRRGRISYQPE